MDEREDAKVLDSRIVDHLDTILQILVLQMTAAHNRSFDCTDNDYKDLCADLICDLSKEYRRVLSC